MPRGLLLAFFVLSACATADKAAEGRGGAVWPAAVRDFSSPEQMLRVAALFPNSSGMERRRLNVAMQAKDAAAALASVRRLATLGAVMSPGAQAQVAQLVGEEGMSPLRVRFGANMTAIAASRVHYTIPTDYELVEGLIWDSNARRLYATTVVGRQLLALDPGEISVAVSDAGFGSLLGGAYDPVRRRLWVSSATVEQTPKGVTPFVGLISYDTATRSLARIPAPEGLDATPGDVAVARDGTVYVSDGMNGAVYRCLPSCIRLGNYLAPGTLFSSQGMAFSPDQKLLYIADRRYGIAALERATGRLFHVTGEGPMMLDGIDGLVTYKGDLIGIQTAYPPARIVRLRLAPGGLRVTGLQILERAHPDWTEPTLGQIMGDSFVYVADAQFDRYGEVGRTSPDKPIKPTAIRIIDLR